MNLNDIIQNYDENELLEEQPWEYLDIPVAFANIVKEYKNQIALIHGKLELTYNELDELSNNLAHFLQNNGIGENSKVGIYFPKSYLYIVSCLGILKTGASYIHIDSNYNNDIISHILQENTPELVLGYTHMLEEKNFGNTKTYGLDTNSEWNKQHIDNNLNPISVSTQKTAIIGYTSGTTGKPKGVDVSHRAAIYSFSKFWQEINSLPEEQKNKFAYVTYLAWDALSPILVGARGVITSDKGLEQTDILIEELVEKEVNHIFVTPTLLKRILEFIINTKENKHIKDFIHNLKVVWIGGEVVTHDIVEKFSEIFSNTLLINNYGPTECWVVSQGKLCAGNQAKEISNGKILPELGYKILDENNNTVKDGKKGYLYVSGPALANGYINNEKLTSEKFIIIDDELYFHTGDICKILPDGGLYILGRENFLTGKNNTILPIEKIESDIKNLEDIIDCVVISSKKTLKSEDILIFIENSGDKLKGKIQKVLEQYDLTYSIYFIDKIPMHLSSQKVDYEKLIEII